MSTSWCSWLLKRNTLPAVIRLQHINLRFRLMRIGKTTSVPQKLTQIFVWRMDDVRFGKPFGGMLLAFIQSHCPYFIWYRSASSFRAALRLCNTQETILLNIYSHRNQVVRLLDRSHRAMSSHDPCLATKTFSGIPYAESLLLTVADKQLWAANVHLMWSATSDTV